MVRALNNSELGNKVAVAIGKISAVQRVHGPYLYEGEELADRTIKLLESAKEDLAVVLEQLIDNHVRARSTADFSGTPCL